MKKLSALTSLMRLNKPHGTLLLALPCFMGIFLAAKNSVYFAPNFNWGDLFYMLILFALGSLVMRSAGCVVNDIFDRKFDAQVARTKSRPLASGKVSLREALILLAALLCVGLIILLQFNFYAIVSGFVAALLLLFYPLMKRITFFPQIFLGLAFNFGIIIADLAINQAITLASLVLYGACICWTLIYDSIYAFQDIEDDLRIGVKSSAIKFARQPKIIFSLLTAAMFILLVFLGYLQEFYWPYYALLMVAATYEIFLILSCDYKNAQKCLKAFNANIVVGVVILFAIMLGN